MPVSPNLETNLRYVLPNSVLSGAARKDMNELLPAKVNMPTDPAFGAKAQQLDHSLAQTTTIDATVAAVALRAPNITIDPEASQGVIESITDLVDEMDKVDKRSNRSSASTKTIDPTLEILIALLKMQLEMNVNESEMEMLMAGLSYTASEHEATSMQKGGNDGLWGALGAGIFTAVVTGGGFAYQLKGSFAERKMLQDMNSANTLTKRSELTARVGSGKESLESIQKEKETLWENFNSPELKKSAEKLDETILNPKRFEQFRRLHAGHPELEGINTLTADPLAKHRPKLEEIKNSRPTDPRQKADSTKNQIDGSEDEYRVPNPFDDDVGNVASYKHQEVDSNPSRERIYESVKADLEKRNEVLLTPIKKETSKSERPKMLEYNDNLKLIKRIDNHLELKNRNQLHEYETFKALDILEEKEKLLVANHTTAQTDLANLEKPFEDMRRSLDQYRNIGQLIISTQTVAGVSTAAAQVSSKVEDANQTKDRASSNVFDKVSQLKTQSGQSARALAKELLDIWKSRDESKAQAFAVISGNIKVN